MGRTGSESHTTTSTVSPAIRKSQAGELSTTLDHETGDTFRQALEVPDAPRPRVVVDLGQVTFMDSSDINVLIAAQYLKAAPPTSAFHPAALGRLWAVRGRPTMTGDAR
ncbi:STAS domain-containing protein [Streptomyces collinus]|uniref:STAS domain-containing protein n=1 Tax=Streptomyces collinus TaxID=42684 RepID=UPI00332A80B8